MMIIYINIHIYTYNIATMYYYKYKNNYLKLKSEVGMAVLKSKQTRLVGIISTYIYSTSLCLIFEYSFYTSLNSYYR